MAVSSCLQAACKPPAEYSSSDLLLPETSQREQLANKSKGVGFLWDCGNINPISKSLCFTIILSFNG